MSRGLPDSLAGVGLSAIGVALIRARESRREDALFDDPFARLFAQAAEEAFFDETAPSDAAGTWERIQHLVDDFYDDRVVATKFFDDYLLSACKQRCEQIVILGAGLDTRALRLPLPAHTPVFEIDLPPMFDFKEHILQSVPDSRPGPRYTIASDLCGHWERDLLASGFRDDVPTAWLEEGVLPYLPDDVVHSVLTTITELSARGSQLAQVAQLAATPTQATSDRYQKLKSLVGTNETAATGRTDRDTTSQLDHMNWQTKVVSQADLQDRYDRLTPNPDGTHYLTAVRV